jgi:hypothetical protein
MDSSPFLIEHLNEKKSNHLHLLLQSKIKIEVPREEKKY